jgi:hypothetical protein
VACDPPSGFAFALGTAAGDRTAMDAAGNSTTQLT